MQTADIRQPGSRNVLFIMCDQLRPDYLSCYGGVLQTPNIDRIAARGLRFDRAFVTSGVCGPSRTSFYTGRYPISHRVTWNRVPLPLDELTLGDYLAEAGRPLHLLGKTHFVPDAARLRRLRPDPEQRRLLDEGGFTPVERYDGHFEPAADSPYRRYLIDQGYKGPTPWTDYVIGSTGADGQFASGWYMRNAPLAARVAAADSETAYLTSRAIGFIEQQGDTPWALHLSYIKPHWPYKAPAPYHTLYGAADAPRPVRADHERVDPHPVFGAYQRLEESECFAQDHVVDAIRPVYMGLVKQIDDELGRLLDRLEQLGRLDDTLIVFTSDHGDLAGDHWLGEKEYFFEPVMRIPLIVSDPSAAARASRGTASEAMVECIDVVPTVLDFLGLPSQEHRVEGRSLLPLLRGGQPGEWRSQVFGHLDYAYREARTFLGRGPQECNGFMVRGERYKYIWWEGYRSQLFDLQEDPQELHDLGTDPGLEPVRRAMREDLLRWLASSRRRTTESSQQVLERTHAHERMMGILIGRW
ncbi:sulfatase-like hydrolase/transferase [Ramlibacter sp. AW1]|uniref:Sulfatase-like hydrolase/transferase n=1 Tax=Ramlibacter aurantiacus TaxID=2801330 RepID=A0A936ZSZ6_9BURK|nr:sulfatase-like hydrolase/transferase [Ramlibacter aurantiacus]MBL0422913.1 sulfatase-like hydrolase/transferase [Ramlibacter aurantiacus]